MDHRYGRAKWGKDGTRSVTSDSYWRQPVRWNREAGASGERHRVFPSLCDPFEDRPELVEPRRRLWRLIMETQSLDWLLLTKRPQNVRRLMREVFDLQLSQLLHDDCILDWIDGGRPPRNLWLGVSVEDQERADERVPILCRIPAAVRFVSYEPALGPVDWTRIQTASKWPGKSDYSKLNALLGFTYSRRERYILNGIVEEKGEQEFVDIDNYGSIDWLIMGGESGPGRRPMEVEWIRDSVEQCRKAGVAAFVKQDAGPRDGMQGRIPDSLWRIRQFPSPRVEAVA